MSGSETQRCVVCDASIHRGATKYCSAACYRIVQRSGSVEARFWAKVQKTPTCWLWTGCINDRNGGYGTIGVTRDWRTAPMYVHRLSWQLAHGSIPDGQSVLHHCDVPHCVNPAHLFLGTQKRNMEDAANRGRLHTPRPSKQKLTSEQVALIRRRAACGELQIALAREFNVTKGCISQLVTGTRRKFDGRAVA